MNAMSELVLRFTDRFVPPAVASDVDPHERHRLRLALLTVWTGVVFTVGFGALYAWAGSPASSAAVALVTVGLLVTPLAFRRGVPIARIGNAVIAVTWLATAIVVARSGGLGSPILVHVFLFPLVTYAACGARSSIAWAVLSGLQVAAFWTLDLAGVVMPSDFSPRALATLRLAAYGGDLATIVLVLGFVASARRATFAAIDANNRAFERTRILDDVHDGVGTQLTGLLVRVRAGAFDHAELAASLESCLDDLRVVVSSDAAREDDLAGALGEVRARFTPRFDAAKVRSSWSFDPDARIDGTLETIRVLQELLTNVLRHAQATTVTIEVRRAEDAVELVVRDDGRGFDPDGPPSGRGLRSMRARARRLGGTLVLSAAEPGTVAVLRLPSRRTVVSEGSDREASNGG